MIRNQDNRAEDKCAEVQNGLALFVGGDIEAAPSADIARHLEQCPVCREQARAARSARDLLVSALALSERRGPDLWPNVRAVLSEDGLLRGRQTADVTSVGATALPLPIQEISSENSASFVTASSAAATAARGAKPRRAGRVFSYAAAAAAAMVLGLWLGRSAFHGPAVETPDSRSTPSNLLNVPPNEGPGIPIVPVVETGGLHPLRHGEVPLHNEARSYFDSPGIQSWQPYDPRQATTVEQRVPRWQ